MPKVFITHIEEETLKNTNFRTAAFTGQHLQLTYMNIKPGEDVGLEKHDTVDQFLRIEQGSAKLQAGEGQDELTQAAELQADDAIIVPAGTWHNVINTGSEELKLYSIYGPPNHPDGTIHVTRADAEAAEAAEHSQPPQT